MDNSRIRFGRSLPIWPALGVCMSLSACFHLPSLSPPPEPVYDVRSATVVSSSAASPRLLAAVGERVNAAIAVTKHDTTLPAVTLTIRITPSEKAQGYQKDRNTAKIDIDASAVDTGSVIAVKSFDSTTFSADSTDVDDVMAEDIAARIRSTYSLSPPRLDN
jgi:hypothetical protein